MSCDTCPSYLDLVETHYIVVGCLQDKFPLNEHTRHILVDKYMRHIHLKSSKDYIYQTSRQYTLHSTSVSNNFHYMTLTE